MLADVFGVIHKVMHRFSAHIPALSFTFPPYPHSNSVIPTYTQFCTELSTGRNYCRLCGISRKKITAQVGSAYDSGERRGEGDGVCLGAV